MTWKSYAAWSGAGLLATYLVSSPAPDDPGRTQSPRPSATSGAAPADIAQEAERLQSRISPEAEYQEPSRNPFRFGGQPAVSRQPARVEPTLSDVPDAPPIDPRPEPPPIRVSGVASTEVDGVLQRTAILVTPAGVVTVREGDMVASEYRVTRIEENAVQLVGSDGTLRRLTVR